MVWENKNKKRCNFQEVIFILWNKLSRAEVDQIQWLSLELEVYTNARAFTVSVRQSYWSKKAMGKKEGSKYKENSQQDIWWNLCDRLHECCIQYEESQSEYKCYIDTWFDRDFYRDS